MADGTTLANAYVQIIPSARGIKGKLTSSLSGETEAAGAGLGKKFGAALIAGVSVGAIVAGFKKIISTGADLEQSIGGIQTMFKGSSNVVIKNANKAWKTAGLSANAYMEQATSFSASLLQSLDGDTKKAASSADMAIRDMSDNSNKFGTNIGDIQNAYQGFAKQNYTMLDNLKLGYGGTKTEMQRLLSDASKLSGQKYDISNLNDVYSAIHVIQKEMGITGTTSKEAATTLTGSFNSMKGAAENFMGALVSGNGKNIQQALKALFSSTETFLIGNLVPAIGRVLSAVGGLIAQAAPKIGSAIQGLFAKLASLISQGGAGPVLAAVVKVAGQIILGLVKGIGAGLPKVLNAITKLVKNMVEKLSEGGGDKMIAAGLKFVAKLALGLLKGAALIAVSAGKLVLALISLMLHLQARFVVVGFKFVVKIAAGLIKGIGKAAAAIGKVGLAIVKGILRYSARMVVSGLRLVVKLATGIAHGSAKAVSAIGKIISSIVKSVIRGASKMISAGLQLVIRMASGIAKGASRAVRAIKNVISKVLSGAKGAISGFLSIGSDIVSGIWNGISNKGEWIKNQISGFVGNVKSWLKKFFKIGSPSKLMADEIGRYIPEGIAVGIDKHAYSVKDSMSGLVDDTVRTALPTLDSGMTLTSKVAASAAGSDGRTVIFNNTFNVDGTNDPETYAMKLARSLKRELRTV